MVGFLESNRISFHEVDIAMLEERRLWMYRHIPRDKLPEKGNPLPPQIFNDDRYCGVRRLFFLADGWRATETIAALCDLTESAANPLVNLVKGSILAGS